MHAYPCATALITAALACALTACGRADETPAAVPYTQPYQKGWGHNCTLSCTNVSVNREETVERPGRTASGTSCSDSRQACEAERAIACANAVAMANNETLYDNCRLVGEGECVEGCTLAPH